MKKTLTTLLGALPSLKHEDVHVLNVRATYGNYQLIIRPKKGGIEIDGEIHHLVLAPQGVTANPTSQQIKDHLKDTMIMKNVHVHFIEEKGTVEAKDFINLAGRNGKNMMARAKQSGLLARETSRIVQEDILHALQQKEKLFE